jgi:phytanoyl-CoA hydroxylase
MAYLNCDNTLAQPLWIDSPGAQMSLDAMCRSSEITQHESEVISQVMSEGYAIVDLPEIDATITALLSEIEKIWQHPPFDIASAGPGHGRPLPMSHGLNIFRRGPGVRLMDIHSHLPSACALYLNERLHRLVSLILGEKAIATQSLYFEYGSTQTLHRDPWYVNHSPRSHLLAAWIALEDITPDAGPLNYVPESHKLPYYRFSTDDIVFHDKRVTDPERASAVQAMHQQIRENHMPVVAALPKRGQAFLWHGNLIHGGSPVLDPTKTRRSFVVHFGRRDTHTRRGGGLSCEGVNRTFFTSQLCPSATGTLGWASPLLGITRADFDLECSARVSPHQ